MWRSPCVRNGSIDWSPWDFFPPPYQRLVAWFCCSRYATFRLAKNMPVPTWRQAPAIPSSKLCTKTQAATQRSGMIYMHTPNKIKCMGMMYRIHPPYCTPSDFRYCEHWRFGIGCGCVLAKQIRGMIGSSIVFQSDRNLLYYFLCIYIHIYTTKIYHLGIDIILYFYNCINQYSMYIHMYTYYN